MISDVLVQDENYHLVRETLPVEKEIIAWLETFLDCGYGKIQIAAICSKDRILTDESLRGLWKTRAEANIVELIPHNAASPILARSICIAVKDMRTTSREEVLHIFFSVVIDALLQIADRIQPENGNDAEISIARDGIKEACKQIEIMSENLEQRLADFVYARQISNYLETGKKDGGLGGRDGFPTVRILFFLPVEAFDVIAKFAEPEFFFFKQIRYVLLNEERKIIDLRMDLAEQIRKYDELKADNTALKAENAVLIEQLGEKDRIIIEQGKQIENLKVDYLRNNDDSNEFNRDGRGRG